MSVLERPIDAPVYFSTLIDGAAEFCKLLTDVVEQPPRPMTRSMNVESVSSLAAGSMMGSTTIIAVHRARSRDPSR